MPRLITQGLGLGEGIGNNLVTEGLGGSLAPPFQPSLITAQSINIRKVRVVFDVAMKINEATDPVNYEISPPLSVTLVVAEDDHTFIVTTAPQVPGNTYTITASDMHDINGNSV